MENSRLFFSETEQQVQFLATNMGSFLRPPIHFLSPNQPLLLLFLCVLRRGEKEKKIGEKVQLITVSKFLSPLSKGIMMHGVGFIWPFSFLYEQARERGVGSRGVGWDVGFGRCIHPWMVEYFMCACRDKAHAAWKA